MPTSLSRSQQEDRRQPRHASTNPEKRGVATLHRRWNVAVAMAAPIQVATPAATRCFYRPLNPAFDEVWTPFWGGK